MNSRMSRYYADNELDNTRYGKNEDLYKEISKSELDNYEVKSNATILGESKAEIDVEKIKQILDTKYKEIPKRKSIRIEEEPEIKEEREITKEYDINVILEKAREEKEENYEEERLKKLRDTQFDILKNLNIDKKDDEDDEESSEEKLKDLINTIALNESKNNTPHNTSLDILSELKGSGNTEVLDGLKEELDKTLEQTELKTLNKDDNNVSNTKMINSFYTSSNALKDKDFEDIEDFQKSIESNNVLIKVVIAIIAIIFIVGIVLIVKNFYFS